MALLNPCRKFKKSFDWKNSFEALWRCLLQKLFLTCLRVHQIQNLGQSEYKTEIFSKRTHKISKIIFNVGSYESLVRLESKIRKCLCILWWFKIFKILCDSFRISSIPIVFILMKTFWSVDTCWNNTQSTSVQHIDY